ncbi:hypothetical protein BH18ACT4_BH18ACT4_07750 [soil metagenome]
MSLLGVSVILLWILTSVLTVLVILLYRQFGLLYLGSSTAVRLRGLQVGRSAPEGLTLVAPDGSTLALDWAAAGAGRGTVLVLTAPLCPLCEKLLSALNGFVDEWGSVVDVVVADRSDGDAATTPRSLSDGVRWRYGVSVEADVHHAFDIDVQPYVFVISDDGVVAARDIVNTTDRLGSIVTACLDESGRIASGRFVDPVELTHREPSLDRSTLAYNQPGYDDVSN